MNTNAYDQLGCPHPVDVNRDACDMLIGLDNIRFHRQREWLSDNDAQFGACGGDLGWMLSGPYPPTQKHGVSQFEDLYPSLTEAAGREGKQFSNELSTASASATDL